VSAVELVPYAGSEALERARAGHDVLAAGRDGRGTDQDRLLARRRVIAALLLKGHTYRDIGAIVGLGKSQVGREVAKIREEWRDRTAVDYQARVDEEDAKLDLVEPIFLAAAAEGSAKGAEILLKIMDRRAKLLGLDKPAKLEVTHPDESAQRQRAQELLGRVDELAQRRTAHTG
jgi:hypothetical protein